MLLAAGSWKRRFSFPVAAGTVALCMFAARTARAAVELPSCKTGPGTG